MDYQKDSTFNAPLICPGTTARHIFVRNALGSRYKPRLIFTFVKKYALAMLNFNPILTPLVCRWLGGVALLGLLGSCHRPAAVPARAQLVSQWQALEQQLRQAPPNQIDTSAVLNLVACARAMQVHYPQDSLAPRYRFTAAESLVAIGRYVAAIGVIDSLLQQYPQFDRRADAQFFKGFVYETGLQDRSAAIQAYQRFIQANPQHPLAADAQILLQNLQQNRSDDELIRDFEQQD